MIPGVSSSKYEFMASPQMRKSRHVSFQNTQQSMTRNGSTPNLNGPHYTNNHNVESPAKKMMTSGLSNSQITPTVSTKKYEPRSPVNLHINPVQNLYVAGGFHRGRSTSNSKTFLAGVGNNSVVNSSNVA